MSSFSNPFLSLQLRCNRKSVENKMNNSGKKKKREVRLGAIYINTQCCHRRQHWTHIIWPQDPPHFSNVFSRRLIFWSIEVHWRALSAPGSIYWSNTIRHRSSVAMTIFFHSLEYNDNFIHRGRRRKGFCVLVGLQHRNERNRPLFFYLNWKKK